MGGLARAQVFTPEYQRHVQSHSSHASLSSAGRLSYEDVVRKYGRAFAADKLDAWRLSQPTTPEAKVITWPDQHHVPNKREVEVDGHWVDFFLSMWAVVVEVDGEVFHGDSRFAYPQKDRDIDRRLAEAGFRVIRRAAQSVLDESALQSLMSRISEEYSEGVPQLYTPTSISA